MTKIPNDIKNIIEDFTNKVSTILGSHLKQIILYGSYARGDFNKDSDIDIMILTDLKDNEIIEYRSKVIEIVYDIEYDNDFDITISPLVKNIDKFNYWLQALPFYMNVQKEGVILNEQ